MKILVTGSNGLLGQKLTGLLEQDPTIQLIATARGKSAVPIKNGAYYSLDIRNAEEVIRVVSLTQPDVIINTAAMTQVDECEQNPDSCWNSNVTGVSNLVAICQQFNIHLIHLSTDFIFDGHQELLDEHAAPNPVNFYGKSKLAAELLVLESKSPTCVIRTVLVYGITQDMSRSNIVLWVKQNLEAGKSIQVVTDQWRTPTLAEDLAIGCLLAAKKNATGIYHISGKDYLSIFDIAQRTADFFHLDKSLIRKTNASQFTQPAARPLRTGFIIDKARKALGYEPRTLEEGMHILSTQIQ